MAELIWTRWRKRSRVPVLRAGKVAYLLCNPHNPTGAVHTVDELRGVADLARRFSVRVVSDEIHAPVILSGSRFTPYLTVPGAENAFALTSASKAWNLSGLKAALAIAGPEAAADLRRMPEEVSHGPSHLGVIAHAEAFRTGGDWLDMLLRGLDENRTLLGDLVAEHLPAVKYQWPQGTYLAWLDCRELGFWRRSRRRPCGGCRSVRTCPLVPRPRPRRAQFRPRLRDRRSGARAIELRYLASHSHRGRIANGPGPRQHSIAH